MILTLTANPSIDRTTTVKGRLERGGVYRLAMESDVPGGKGVNVSAAVANAGHDTLALYPAANNGRFSASSRRPTSRTRPSTCPTKPA